MMQIHLRFGAATAKRRLTLPQSMTARFVVMPRRWFEFHCLPIPISNAAEIPLITIGTDMSSVSQGPWKRERPGTSGETDPGTHLEVLPGMDRVRRFHLWKQDKDDERVREEMLAARVHWSRDLRGRFWMSLLIEWLIDESF